MMILEGIVTTRNADGSINVAPMGPIVDVTMETLVLRPFLTSTTYANLKRQGEGVLHVTDDVLLLARAAINRLEQTPESVPAIEVNGAVLTSTCRWYEFQVTELDDREERTRIQARVVHVGRRRDFFGFNRAKHAVLEAAILATRLHLIPQEDVLAEFARLSVPIEKTAGADELAAFELLREYVVSFERE
jgi:hypothetical protein